jgi:hypothetical protein
LRSTGAAAPADPTQEPAGMLSSDLAADLVLGDRLTVGQRTLTPLV